ncbi:TetR family transcriptional regulator [Actinomadura sp. NTSP31]|uniref:TetR/AcrR family transcriptional regulator n=1 Tax=Actinomadura sp. NTSP31 TaxID=1735447 RepID=UPI0035C19FC5
MNDAHGDLRPEGDPTDASDIRSPRPPGGGSPIPSAPPTETTAPAGTATLPGGPAGGSDRPAPAGGTTTVPSGSRGVQAETAGRGTPLAGTSPDRGAGGAIATTTRPGEVETLAEDPGEPSPRPSVPPARVGEPEGGNLSPGGPRPPGFGGGPLTREPRTFQRDTGQDGRQPARGTAPGGQVSARQERREQTRTALLSAAERLWAERGIHGASLDDIAAAAGLTKGAVYSNFAGKTDLLLALLERFTSDRLGTDVCDELRSADQSRDEDERTGRGAARDGSDDRARRLALLLVEFWLYGMRDYAAGWRIADWYAERRAHMASELRDVDGIAPSERAALAMALDFGLAFQHLLDPDRVPADLYSTGIDLMLGRAAS